MDVIDGEWIRRRLTGRRGERADLARALDVKQDVVSKILKGTRAVQPGEIPRVLQFFGERFGGLSEDARPYALGGSSEAGSEQALRIARVVSKSVVHPVLYQVSHDIFAFAYLAGDVLVVDLNKKPDSGDIVLVTLQGEHGEGLTCIRRMVGSLLISASPTAPPLDSASNEIRAHVHGPVCGTLRGAGLAA